MKTMIKIAGVSAMALFILAFAVLRTNNSKEGVKELPGTVILEWNEVAYEAFGGPTYLHSLMASRINAITHLAMHDALNAVEPVYNTYAFKGKDAKANPVAAAATAAYTVLLSELPNKKGFLDSALQKSLTTIADGDAKNRGVELGKQAAAAILAARKNDGATGELMVKVPVSNAAGIYEAVPPFGFVFAPHWEDVRLFSLKAKDQFRSAPPPTLNSQTYISAYTEVKDVGCIASKVRTKEATFYSKYWYEFSEAGWNRVARVAAINKQLNLIETARLFALVNMALADSYIAGWDAKLHYNFWRPYTAIRKANIDGNPKTQPDTSWASAEPTPPIQDYPSTHSALGNAAATVLARILGDQVSFAMTSPTANNEARRFKSFSEAANENADSRVQAGLHFRFSCEAGQRMGNEVGNWTVDHYLGPVK